MLSSTNNFCRWETTSETSYYFRGKRSNMHGIDICKFCLKKKGLVWWTNNSSIRVLMTKWVGTAWSEMSKNEDMINWSFKKCGISLAGKCWSDYWGAGRLWHAICRGSIWVPASKQTIQSWKGTRRYMIWFDQFWGFQDKMFWS